MQRFWLRLILLFVLVFMQSCCWSQCPQPGKSAVEWHTPVQAASGS